MLVCGALQPNGAQTPVTLDDLEMYTQLVAQHILIDSVLPAVTAFRDGFGDVAPVRSLRLFFAHELGQLMCGDELPWSAQMFAEHMLCEHGYTHASGTIAYLIQVLCEFDVVQRRQFLQFATGSARLPIGGFAALHPRLTVVRRTTEGNPDQYLPSVMTCTNYLKMPEYSSVEVLRARLLYAMQEGQQAFHLS